jgi:hypothetical protein
MLQAEDMSHLLDAPHFNLDFRRGIWRSKRKEEKHINILKSTSNVLKEPSDLDPSTSAALAYHRSGHRYLARMKIRRKVNVLDNRRTFLKRDWKTDDDGWGQATELEMLRDAGIEVSHTPLTWAEQILIDYKRPGWYRCYRSSMLRWSWGITEEGKK